MPKRVRAGPGLNVHHLVASTAMEMANEMFEVYARDNKTYRALRADNQVSERDARVYFVRRVSPKLYEDARAALTTMLAQPDDQVPTALKDQIAEALILDNDLRARRFVATEQAHIPRHLH